MTSNVPPPNPGDARDLHQLLEAVLEALDIPAPATVGDTDAHHALLADRAMDAVVALQTVLKAPGDCAGWSADYLRARLAEKPPTGYQHWQDLVEETQAAARAAQASVDRAFPHVAAFLADEKPAPTHDRCARCKWTFDPNDTAFDGRARYRETPYCRSCVDRCHDGGAEHVCVVCDPARYGGEPQ